MKRRNKNSLSNLQIKKHRDLPMKKHPSIDLPRRKRQSMKVRKHANNKREFVHFVGKGLLLAIFVGVAISGIVYVWSISTSKAQSETFTELYFEDSFQLPSKVVPKHLYSFQFIIHNLEGKDLEYSYQVYAKVGHDKLIFDKSAVFVKQNGYITIAERFATKSVWPKSEIIVELMNKNQQIDFWIEGSM